MNFLTTTSRRIGKRALLASLFAGSALLGVGFLGSPGAGALTLPSPPPRLPNSYTPTETTLTSFSSTSYSGPGVTEMIGVTVQVLNSQTGAPVTSGTMTINWTDNTSGQTWSCEQAPISVRGTAECSFSNETGLSMDVDQIGSSDEVQALYNGGRVYPGIVNDLYGTSESPVYGCSDLLSGFLCL
jgi:hypothetical protein